MPPGRVRSEPRAEPWLEHQSDSVSTTTPNVQNASISTRNARHTAREWIGIAFGIKEGTRVYYSLPTLSIVYLKPHTRKGFCNRSRRLLTVGRRPQCETSFV